MPIKYKLPLIYLGVFIFGFAGTYFTLTFFKINLGTKAETIDSTQVAEERNLFEDIGENTTEKEESFNAVLLGSGGQGHSGGDLTDSIIIIHVEKESKKAALISIPRDLYIPGNYKINASVVNVGVENLKGTLQNITGLEIEKYASIDFGSLISMIDQIGGIEVTLNKPYEDKFYPVKGLENELCGKSPEEVAGLHAKYSGFDLEKQFECRYEQIHFDAGTTKVDGEKALKFARSRHGDSDFGRSGRQFAILLGIIKKLSTQSPFETIADAYKDLSQIVKTDLNLEEALALFEIFGNPENYEIKQIQLTDQNVLISATSQKGEYILQPRSGRNDFSAVKEYINSNIN